MKPRRLLFLLLIPLLAVALAGCRTRPRNLVTPPVDLSDPIDQSKLRKLISAAELQVSQAQEYYLGPGDVISVQLIGRPDVLTNNTQQGAVEVTLTDSPMMSLPLVGAIPAHGKTASQLEDDLRVAYSKFLVNPQPVVLVKVYNRNQIAVLGSVQAPGKYPYEFGDTALDGIFKAKGLSQGGRGGGLAPGPYMKIYRERVTGEKRAGLTMDELVKLITTPEGAVVPRDEIVIPIKDFIFNGSMIYNIPLQQNDIIYIPPAGTAMVQGRVQNPGVTFLGPSVSTLTQLVVEKGGLRYGADSDIEVVRRYRDGQTVSYFMDAREMLDREAADFALQDGDQVFVYTHPVRAVGEMIGQIFQGSVRAGASATYNPIAP